MTLRRWKAKNKRTYEDELLLKYWQEVGGLIFAEVTVGKGGTRNKWPKGAKPRRIDAVRILTTTCAYPGGDIFTFKKTSSHVLREKITGENIEVIEIKRALDRVVLGQVIIGADLLELEYAPATIEQTVVCEEGDPVLESVCDKRGIKVWRPPIHP